ncbi:MAG: hypothetical protein U5K36_08085 [Roseovarius sp.]|nr:hypothetical protein [Roseovarius sp.]
MTLIIRPLETGDEPALVSDGGRSQRQPEAKPCYPAIEHNSLTTAPNDFSAKKNAPVIADRGVPFPGRFP